MSLQTHTSEAPLVPSADQLHVASTWKEVGGLLLDGDTGSGKTLAAITGFLELGTKVNLIVAPLHTFSGWRRTLKRQTGQELQFIDASKQGKQVDRNLQASLPGFYFIGRERFRTYNWRHYDIDAVVLDEVHFIANRNSKSFKTAKTLSKVPYKMGMSATVAGNNFAGMYSVSKFIFPDDVGNSFWRWVDEWCTTEYDPFAYKAITGEREPGKYIRNLPAYIKMVTPYQEQPIIQYIDVDLTPTQYKIYKQLEEEAILWYEEHPTYVDLPTTLYMRLLQTTLAVPKLIQWFDEEGKAHTRAEFPEKTRSTKTDIFLDLLKDIPEDEAIICYSHSKIFVEYLHNRLVDAGHASRVFNSQDATNLIEGLGKDYRILCTTQQAIGEGTDGLQNQARYEVWFSFSDNRLLNKQASGRLNRQGQTEQVYRYVIRANDTVETDKQHPRLLSGEEILQQSFNLGESA